VFPTVEALEKIVYLKMGCISEKWVLMAFRNCASILSEMMIYFEDSVSDWGEILD